MHSSHAGTLFPAQGAPRDTITALHCHGSLRLTKAFRLEGGRIVEEGYGRAGVFHYTDHLVGDIFDLHELVKHHQHSPHTCLIRGVPADNLPKSVRRNGENFPMQEGGAQWVCLDFDGVDLPEGIDPYGPEAIEYAISLLPSEFHTATYVAQFSSSAGVLNPDGTPYKPGLRAHVFFWFDRRVTNEELKGWLFDYPVDMALFTAVQPHYVADPVLGSGVRCAVRHRLYLTRKYLRCHQCAGPLGIPIADLISSPSRHGMGRPRGWAPLFRRPAYL